MFLAEFWSVIEWDITWASFWFDTWDLSNIRHTMLLVAIFYVGGCINIFKRPNLLLKTPYPVDRKAQIDYIKLITASWAMMVAYFWGSGYFELAVWKVLSLGAMNLVLSALVLTKGEDCIRARLAALAQEDEENAEMPDEGANEDGKRERLEEEASVSEDGA